MATTPDDVAARIEARISAGESDAAVRQWLEADGMSPEQVEKALIKAHGRRHARGLFANAAAQGRRLYVMGLVLAAAGALWWVFTRSGLAVAATVIGAFVAANGTYLQYQARKRIAKALAELDALE